MFADAAIARRVERAEALVMRAMAGALVGTARAPGAFVHEIAAGVASYVRPGSPLNKVIGVGLDAPIGDEALGTIERAFGACREPVRIEVATVAAPQTCEQLGARGYRLIGFENVLARSLAQPPPHAGDIRTERVTEATLPAFRDTVVAGTLASDATGVVADAFSREVIETVIDDSLCAAGFARYIAYERGTIAGGASMQRQDGIAVLTGSATRPQHRRRGVQAALLARRLADARDAGADLAIITTSPATQSQANVMKLGFSLIYARALLVSVGHSQPS
jgi:GNAT superfamily N-acetyltransferase